MKGGGRGYYRPPSLLSVWAYAPFMHNNAIGPEVCGKPSSPSVDFYSSPYVDDDGKPVANPPPCVPFDPSVEGRYQLFKALDGRSAQPDAARPQGQPRRRGHHRRHRAGLQARRASNDGLSIKLPKGYAGGPDQQPALTRTCCRISCCRERDPAKLAAKYQDILTAAQLQRVEGRSRAAARLDATAAAAATSRSTSRRPERDFIQTLLFERARPGRERRPSVRRRPVGSREAGADRLPGNACRAGTHDDRDGYRPNRAAALRLRWRCCSARATAARSATCGARHPVRADRRHRAQGPRQSDQGLPHRFRPRRARISAVARAT